MIFFTTTTTAAPCFESLTLGKPRLVMLLLNLHQNRLQAWPQTRKQVFGLWPIPIVWSKKTGRIGAWRRLRHDIASRGNNFATSTPIKSIQFSLITSTKYFFPDAPVFNFIYFSKLSSLYRASESAVQCVCVRTESSVHTKPAQTSTSSEEKILIAMFKCNRFSHFTDGVIR